MISEHFRVSISLYMPFFLGDHLLYSSVDADIDRFCCVSIWIEIYMRSDFRGYLPPFRRRNFQAIHELITSIRLFNSQNMRFFVSFNWLLTITQCISYHIHTNRHTHSYTLHAYKLNFYSHSQSYTQCWWSLYINNFVFFFENEFRSSEFLLSHISSAFNTLNVWLFVCAFHS